ncbi:MAG: hypothetical protein ACPG9K_01995 [Poseidonibacter sp.]
MKNKLHSTLIYPLIIVFSSFLKGKKSSYSNFFIDKKPENSKENILNVTSKNNKFYENIKYFFDKNSIIYDKTRVLFQIDTSSTPEEKTYMFDFFKVVNVYHAMSMLGAKIPNENIEIELVIKKERQNNTQINNLLRTVLLAFASRKVDKVYFDKESLKDEKSLLAYETMISYLDKATIVNFSNAKSLYVLTCKKDKKTFDIVWSSQDDIELTEFNKVYDKYAKEITKDIKITNSPIYALHK